MSTTIKQLRKSKTQTVKINTALNKLAEQVLFPRKVEEANKVLKTVGLPRTWKTQH
ncbi:MAG: hypothetical protein JNM68_11540 [Dinghuibacter sp.]|nr:hypothetical protein [Dinghuibacter sp.]